MDLPSAPLFMVTEAIDSRKHLLEGILVIDVADEGGDFVSKLLADLGATVVRIIGQGESPLDNHEPRYLYHNGGKSHLTLDFANEKDMAAFRKLAKEAQVLIETPSPTDTAANGLGCGEARLINTGLIHLSVTPFGLAGPKAQYRSCHGVLSAASGQMYLSGSPAGPPLEPFGHQSAYAASLFGAVAVVAALRERSITGKGTHIDLSMQESVAATLDHVMVDYFSEGKIAKRQGSIYGDMAFSVLPCSDGFIDMNILQSWDTLLELMASDGKAGDLLDQRWHTEAYRREHFDHILKAVGCWTVSHGKDELFHLGQAMRFPWAPLFSFAEVIESPQLQSRGYFLTGKATGSEQTLSVPGPPYRTRSKSPVPKAGPSHAEDAPPRQGVPAGILQGIRVLDFTRMLAGPYATRMLADYGAEVIKVQSRKTARGAEENGTPYFNTWNRNKRSITLDLGFPEARDMALRLAGTCDIVVENYSPRMMAQWGLTYDHLCAVRKDVIMASISAMGQDGPWKDFVGYAPTFHALSGLTGATSSGTGEPVCLGHAYGDIVTGLYAALTILAALEHRDRTGQGTYIDLSAYESLCSVVGGVLTGVAMESNVKTAAGNLPSERRLQGRLEGSYPCRGDDRWCFIAIADEEDWRRFCTIVDGPDLVDEWRPDDTNHERKARLNPLIGGWTQNRPAEEVERLLQAAGVAASVVQNTRDLAHDRQLEARGFFVPLNSSGQDNTRSDRTPIFFGRDDPGHWKKAPALGEDNLYVFSELLGLSETDMESYVKKGIIG